MSSTNIDPDSCVNDLLGSCSLWLRVPSVEKYSGNHFSELPGYSEDLYQTVDMAGLSIFFLFIFQNFDLCKCKVRVKVENNVPIINPFTVSGRFWK